MTDELSMLDKFLISVANGVGNTVNQKRMNEKRMRSNPDDDGTSQSQKKNARDEFFGKCFSPF